MEARSCPAHSHSMPVHNQELIQLLGVARVHVVQPLNCEFERHIIAEPQIDDAGMRQALAHYHFPEISVISDENATVHLGDAQHIETGRP